MLIKYGLWYNYIILIKCGIDERHFIQANTTEEQIMNPLELINSFLVPKIN